ncbi:hypothetical protein [Poriferisphaera corsica]|nr:hypothetical protein [Poriferisphaera corsica]
MNNRTKLMGVMLMVAGLMTMGGCNIIGWMAAPYGSDESVIEVKAEYTKLEGKKIAVLVAASDEILYKYNEAILRTSRAITARMAENMPSIRVMDPTTVLAYQRNNPFWSTSGYENLIDALNVDAVVVVDLSEYRTHEPGNKYQWKGIVAGHVTVAEGNEAVFAQTVRAEFPEDSKVGVLDSSDEKIQLGMLSIFSRDAAGLFYDHEIVRKK